MRRHRLTIGLLALTIGIAGCEGPTTYHPANPSDQPADRTGYWDYRIEENRYRVNFAGNSMTSRDTVERYLLFRAAELTLQQGYDWFEMADRGTERKSQTYVDRPFSTGPYGYWGPWWSYRSPRFGWRTWDPFWGDPFWDRDLDVRTVDRYEASAEIVMGHGSKPASPRAFDAREVASNLRGSIEVPH